MPMRNSDITWDFPEPIPVPAKYQLDIGGSKLVAQTLFRRGLDSPAQALAFLDPNLYQPTPPTELPGLEKATERLVNAVNDKERILVWGDFDVDGQTSTALLISSLDLVGAITQHHIPVRALESHGMTPAVLADKIRSFSPDLIITCDTGIDALESVDLANQSGIDVIITDHHQLPPTLPDAYAIVNPSMLSESHPLYNLPGVGVAYKLVEELYSQYSQNPTYLLDLVALGIVADVAAQTLDTRYLLQRGLKVLRNTPRLGLLEICKRNDLDPAQINEEHIGFILGPRLNALGRLDDANSSVDFLTTDDPFQAAFLAQRLEDLNKTRQQLTEDILQDAEKMIAAYPELIEEYPILVLQGSPQWNPGVIGIVASRLVERYNKPTIMLSQDGENARGSARSISGVPISKLISTTEELLNSFGGHPMAAGVNLPLENVSQFRRTLAQNYHTVVGDIAPKISITIDSEITFCEINEEMIRDFHRLAPFGAGNPKLTFATRGVFTKDSNIKPIGRTGNHRKITFTDANGDQADLLWWNSAEIPIPDMPLDIAYSLEISTFRNKPQIQTTLKHIRHSPESPVLLPDSPHLQLIDLRSSTDPIREVAELSLPSKTIIWAENIDPISLPTVSRSKLTSCDVLIIWSAPPSKYVLSQALLSATPNKVILIGAKPLIDNLESFIEALLGLIKHVKSTGKPSDLTRFSEILAVPQEVVELGIEWIHSQGTYDLSKIDEGIVIEGPRYSLPDFQIIDSMLKQMLREMFSYRSYFKNAHIRAIL